MMRKIFWLIVVLLVALQAQEGEDSSRKSEIGGLEIGNSNFNNSGHISIALCLGVLSVKQNLFLAQFVYNSEVLIGPYMDSPALPVEKRYEINALYGRLIKFSPFYLKITGGLGYFYEIQRGKEYITSTDNTYNKLTPNGIGFPLELSLGVLDKIGYGLKIKGLVGQDNSVGFMFEVFGIKTLEN